MRTGEKDLRENVNRLTRYDHDTEYIGDDGLIRCRACGEPKQFLFEADKGCPYHLVQSKAMPRLCRCERERADEEERRAVAEQVERRTADARAECFGTSSYAKARFDTSDGGTEQFEKCLAYAEAFDRLRPDGMLLYGTVGSGKTHLAACIANRVIDNGFTAKFTNIARASGIVTSSYGNVNALDQLARYDLVVLDDLGVERGDERTAERQFHIVNTLIDAEVALVFTTNLDIKSIADPANPGYRIYSRILGECNRVKFDGRDRRKDLGKEKADRFRKVLEERLNGRQNA